MSCRHQNPDDLNCLPAVFKTFDPDGTVEQTFWIRNPWHLSSTAKIGELVVRENMSGPLIKIVMENEQ